MLLISKSITIPDAELDITAIRSQGAGGQNVNKVATAAHLRFDITASSLPDHCKARLRACRDHRITEDGVIIIKAQEHRSQEQNREEVRQRLKELILKAMVVRKKRRPTKPGKAAKQRRLKAKVQRSEAKARRTKQFDY